MTTYQLVVLIGDVLANALSGHTGFCIPVYLARSTVTYTRGKLPIDGVAAHSLYLKLKELIKAFADDDLQKYPTLFPNRTLEKMRFDGSEEAFKRSASYTFSVMGVDPSHVKTVFINTEEAREKYAMTEALSRSEGTYSEEGVAGVYSTTGINDADQGIKDTDALIIIDLLSFVGASLESLIATLAHECAHHRVFARTCIDPQDEEMADLLPVLRGFGLFMTNSSLEYRTSGDLKGPWVYHSWSYHRFGYLSQEEFAFALALTSAWKREPGRELKEHLVPNPRSVFLQSRRFLSINGYDPFHEPGPHDIMLSLERRLQLEENLSIERHAAAKPSTIDKVEIKWQGTFIGAPILEDGRVAEPMSDAGIDFGESSKTLVWQPGVCFGIAYRIISRDFYDFFIVTETIDLLEADRSGATATIKNCREIAPREIQCLACVMGEAPCLGPGVYRFQVWQDQNPLVVRELIVLRADQVPGG